MLNRWKIQFQVSSQILHISPDKLFFYYPGATGCLRVAILARPPWNLSDSHLFYHYNISASRKSRAFNPNIPVGRAACFHSPRCGAGGRQHGSCAAGARHPRTVPRVPAAAGGDPGRLPLRPGGSIPRGTRRAAGDTRGGGGTAGAPAQGPTAPAPRRQPQLLPPGSARGCGRASSPPRYAQRHIDPFSALFFWGGLAISSRFLPKSSRNATWRTPAGQRQRPLPKYTTKGDSAAHPLHPPTCAGAHGALEGPRPPPLPPPVTAPPRVTPSPPAAAQPAAGQPRSAPPAGAAHPQPRLGAARLGGHLGKCRQLRTRGLHPPLCVAAAGRGRGRGEGSGPAAPAGKAAAALPLHRQKLPHRLGETHSLLSPACPPALHPAPLCFAGELFLCIFLPYSCLVCMMPERSRLVHRCFSMSPKRPRNDDGDVCVVLRRSRDSKQRRITQMFGSQSSYSGGEGSPFWSRWTLTNPSYLKVQGHQCFIKASLFSIASIWKSTIVLEEIMCKKPQNICSNKPRRSQP